MLQAVRTTTTGSPFGTPDFRSQDILSMRAFLEARIERDIALLDQMDGDADLEWNGDEFEDVEGDYSIPGGIILPGMSEDDEDDDADEDEDGLS